MSEPQIMIPASIAIRAATQLQAVNSELFPGRAPQFQKLADYLINAVSEQLTDDEVSTTLVAASAEMSNE